MANENFMRTYTMKCGKKGGKGFAIGNIHSPTETTLHISFSVEKCDVESPNTAKVQVWNLSNENLKILETKDCFVELKAGYGNDNALILAGNVTSVITVPENADRMTEMEVVDGRAPLRDTVIRASINGAVDSKEVYKMIAKQMGMPIVFAGDLSFKKMPKGFRYCGKAKNALQKIANYNGHRWTIQNNVIQITIPGRAIKTKGFLLGPDTGLISIPKRVMIGETSSNGGAQTGWEVEYLLNGAIGINDVVILRSSAANGYYRVYKVTIDGDNLEGDWICTAQLLKIKEQPKLDKKAKSGTSSKNKGIKIGDKVKVVRTFKQGGKIKGYRYAGGTFVCQRSAYDVIRVNGDAVSIGKGGTVNAVVNIKDLAKV